MKRGEVAGSSREEVREKSGVDSENNSNHRQNTLYLATCSDLRSVILLPLRGREKAISKLRDELNVSSTTAIHSLLENIVGLVETEEAFKNFLRAHNLALSAMDGYIKIAFTLTDTIFYPGLFADNGIYDYTTAMISDNEKALSWGRKLHKHLPSAIKSSWSY